MEKTQKLIIKGIVIKEDKILLVKRKKEGNPVDNKWELPGGKIELGERLEDAALREIQEEAGIICSPIKICIENYQNIASGGIYGNHLIIIPVLCNFLREDVNYIGDHNVRDVSWVSKKDLLSLDLLDGTKEMIKDIF